MPLLLPLTTDTGHTGQLLAAEIGHPRAEAQFLPLPLPLLEVPLLSAEAVHCAGGAAARGTAAQPAPRMPMDPMTHVELLPLLLQLAKAKATQMVVPQAPPTWYHVQVATQ